MAAPHVEEAEKAKFENEELRLRLADAISRATEAQRTLALSSGGAVESTEELGTTLDSNEQVGAMFGPREARGLGRGWPVLRVRPESWAERCGVQNGDELHRANGQPIEVLPEEEVMELLRQRPVELTWVRRSLRTSDPEASTPAAEPSDPEVSAVENGQSGPVSDPSELEARLAAQEREAQEALAQVQAHWQQRLEEREAKSQALEEQLLEQLLRVTAELGATTSQGPFSQAAGNNGEAKLEQQLQRSRDFQEQLECLKDGMSAGSEAIAQVAELQKQLEAAEAAADAALEAAEAAATDDEQRQAFQARIAELEQQLATAAPAAAADPLANLGDKVRAPGKLQLGRDLRHDGWGDLNFGTADAPSAAGHDEALATAQELGTKLEDSEARSQGLQARIAELETQLTSARAEVAPPASADRLPNLDDKLVLSRLIEHLAKKCHYRTEKRRQDDGWGDLDLGTPAASVAAATLPDEASVQAKRELEQQLQESEARSRDFQEQLECLKDGMSAGSEAIAQVAELQKQLEAAEAAADAALEAAEAAATDDEQRQAFQARIAELEQQLATVAPAAAADPLANLGDKARAPGKLQLGRDLRHDGLGDLNFGTADAPSAAGHDEALATAQELGTKLEDSEARSQGLQARIAELETQLTSARAEVAPPAAADRLPNLDDKLVLSRLIEHLAKKCHYRTEKRRQDDGWGDLDLGTPAASVAAATLPDEASVQAKRELEQQLQESEARSRDFQEQLECLKDGMSAGSEAIAQVSELQKQLEAAEAAADAALEAAEAAATDDEQRQAFQARIAELEQQLATVAPAAAADPLANLGDKARAPGKRFERDGWGDLNFGTADAPSAAGHDEALATAQELGTKLEDSEARSQGLQARIAELETQLTSARAEVAPPAAADRLPNLDDKLVLSRLIEHLAKMFHYRTEKRRQDDGWGDLDLGTPAASVAAATLPDEASVQAMRELEQQLQESEARSRDFQEQLECLKDGMSAGSEAIAQVAELQKQLEAAEAAADAALEAAEAAATDDEQRQAFQARIAELEQQLAAAAAAEPLTRSAASVESNLHESVQMSQESQARGEGLQARIEELESQLAARADTMPAATAFPLAQDDGWGDLDLGAPAANVAAATLPDEASVQAKLELELEQQLQESEASRQGLQARIAELENQLAAKALSSQGGSSQDERSASRLDLLDQVSAGQVFDLTAGDEDDGWGELDLGTPAASVAAAPLPDEGSVQAKRELEQQLQESEARSRDFQEQLECLKDGMSAGSEAMARVAELQKQLEAAEAAAADNEQRQAFQARIAELEQQLATKADVAPAAAADLLANLDDGWGDFDVGADAQAAPVDSEALTKAKLELEQKFQASEARIAELESQLAAKADSTPAAIAAVQDDGWGDLDLGTPAASVAAAPLPDEASVQAKRELEQQLQESEARSRDFQEQLECLKDGMSAGSEAMARARIAELEQQLATKADVAPAAAADPLANLVDLASYPTPTFLIDVPTTLQDDGWGDFDVGADAQAAPVDSEALTKAKLELEQKFQASEARIAELESHLAAKADSTPAAIAAVQDDGWGDLDLGTPAASVAAAPLPDEGSVQAKRELEQQLQESEARSRDFQEQLECLKDGMSAGSEAMARARIAELEQQLATKADVAPAAAADPLANLVDLASYPTPMFLIDVPTTLQDDGWGDFDVGADAQAAPVDSEALTKAKLELEQKFQASEARIAELENHLAAKADTTPAAIAAVQDDGWGDLDLGTPAANVATAPLPDEASVQAKRELEQQLQESEARSRDFQEQLECLKDGMSAGSEAMARVAELQKQLEAAEAAAADNEQRQAFQARIAELEQQLATKADVAPAAAADPLANLVDDGWGDFDVGADAQAAPVDSEALTKAKLELEQKFQASEARIAELESQLAAKADTTPAAIAAVQDDDWGDLDLGTPAANVAAAPLPDEASVHAKRELEQQLQESEARSRDFQEQLECLKDGMSAGSEAMARVAELQKQLEAAEAAAADNEQRQAFQARIAELEQQLATKADVAPAAAADLLANLVDDGWGDFDVGADAQAAPVDSEALTKAKLELEQKFQASEARIAELESQLAAKADTTPAAIAAVQDDGWGDLDLSTPAANVAAATLPDEASVQAKRELEQQLQESEARSRDFQEQLECLKDGMSAGSEAMARVAELQKQLEAAEAAAADDEQRQAFQARIAELEQQLATKADVAPAAAADPLANLVDDGWGDFDVGADAQAAPIDSEALTKAKLELEQKFQASEARIAELESQLAAKADTTPAAIAAVQDDGWGDLDLGTPAANVAAAPLPDEASVHAKRELEQQLQESEARSRDFQEQLECLKDGMSAGS
ncbi:unnamed protein product, partial [Polarella glacialis]